MSEPVKFGHATIHLNPHFEKGRWVEGSPPRFVEEVGCPMPTVSIFQSLPSPGATVCIIDTKEVEVDMGELRRVMTAAGTNMAEIVRHPDGRLDVVKHKG